MVLFLKVFLTEFIAEMGDKTQLMLIALTSKYKLKDIILGTAAAILVLNGMAVLAGGLVSEFIPDWLIKTIAALAFLYFAASTISGDDDEEEEEGGKSKIQFAPLAVFCTKVWDPHSLYGLDAPSDFSQRIFSECWSAIS